MESAVQVTESCLVAPREAIRTKGLWLSSNDLLLARVGHVPIVCLYRSGASFLDVARLKEALAKALVAFYPLAGRLCVDDDGRMEICCNGEGALFVVARSPCLTAQDVDFSKPSAELKSMFVPAAAAESSSTLMLATQVTFLKCGAVVLGTSFHHAGVDGVGWSHFMQTWSALYRGDGGGEIKVEELPWHDHTLLRSRSPPVVHPDAPSWLHHTPLHDDPPPTCTIKAFPITRDQLVTLKRLCGGSGGSAVSTFVSLSALLWQCMGVVRRIPPEATMRLGFIVNVRRYVRPPLPAHYFGNALAALWAKGAAGDITSETLPSVAARISGAIARMDDELVRSMIDYVELAANNMPPRSSRGDLPETDLWITSWLNMQFGMDLGYGGPEVVTGLQTISNGTVYLSDDYGPENHRGVRVLVCMEPANIDEFQRLLFATIARAQQA